MRILFYKNWIMDIIILMDNINRYQRKMLILFFLSLHLQQLVTALLENKSLLDCHFPDHIMEVEISDSDDSDDEKKKELDDDDGILDLIFSIFNVLF